MMRVFKKNVMSCWECPGRDPNILKMDDGKITGEGFCNQYEIPIPPEYLRVETRFDKFPEFCKLKQAR